MNLDILVDAGIDCYEAMKRLGASEELYLNYMVQFPEDDSYECFTCACNSGDVRAALEFIHKLKGITANLGMTKLYDVCHEIVSLIKADGLDDISPMKELLSESYSEACVAISKVTKQT